MKKIVLFLCVLFALNSNAQIIFQQGFEDGIAPMTLVDVDMQTAAANVAEFADAWTAANPASGNGTNVAVSNSWYAPAGTADDWMITPAIEITSDLAVLEWEAKAQDPNFPDGYEVLISTTDTELASFTNAALTVANEVADWTDHTISLADYNGMTIHIAFRNNSTDQFLLYVDNITVRIPTGVEGSLVVSGDAIKIIDAPGQTKNFDFVYTNSGTDAVTSFDFVYSVDGGADVTMSSTTTVESGASTTLTTGDLEVGEHQIIAVVNNVNGTDFATNSVTSDVIVEVPIPNYTGTDVHGNDYDLHQLLSEGKVIVLDFFASWCGPCEISTPILNDAWVNLGSGDNSFEVFGLTVEPNDDANVVLNLGWGAEYPKFAYTPRNDYFWTIFNGQFGSGGIPLFIMICPDIDNPGFSSVSWSNVGSGISASNIEAETAACIALSTVDVAAEYGVNVYPNPVSERTNVEFNMPTAENVKISIFNAFGQEVAVKNLGFITSGLHTEAIDLNQQAAGIYQILIQFGDKVASSKITVIK